MYKHLLLIVLFFIIITNLWKLKDENKVKKDRLPARLARVDAKRKQFAVDIEDYVT